SFCCSSFSSCRPAPRALYGLRWRDCSVYAGREAPDGHPREVRVKKLTRRTLLAGTGALVLSAPLLSPRVARAANYGPGVTDKEIKLGNTGPYSGPASGY